MHHSYLSPNNKNHPLIHHHQILSYIEYCFSPNHKEHQNLLSLFLSELDSVSLKSQSLSELDSVLLVLDVLLDSVSILLLDSHSESLELKSASE